MKKLLSGIFLFAFICVINIYAQPKIEIEGGDTYNWNKVSPKDSPLHTKIKIKNSGTEKLIISNVRPSCGCTAALLDTNQVLPGNEATLDVKLNISNRPGAVIKTVSIASNDPKNPNINLNLKAEVHVDIEVTPGQYFTFNQMKVSEESVAKVTLINHSEKSITFSDFTVQPESLSVNLSKEITLKPNEQYEIVARAKPDKKGYFSCSLKMKTTDADYPELVIQGYGTVNESPIFTNPENKSNK
jgi:hypothetical protein